MMAAMRQGRRSFLQCMAAAAAAPLALSQDAPRATSGDASEPDWSERLTVTVGPAKADITGSTERALQAAVDSVARLGGGTVRILPGIYKLRNSVYLPGRIRILGSGADSILVKEPSVTTTLAADSDWYEQEITLSDARGFELGDGICVRAKDPDTNRDVVLKRTLVARNGSRFKLDKALRDNLWLEGKPTVSTLFPIFSGDTVSDIGIENLVLDGNKSNNANLDGNYAGCVFLQDVNRVTLRRIEARNYNGDGLSWQICHDVLVEDCHSHDHTGLGFHPGSGSQRSVIRNNRAERNDIGIFFCWGVRFGRAEGNTISDNRKCGVSIGHRDNDNLILKNVIRSSGEAGILFRSEPDVGKSASRNRVEANEIIDSGPDNGIAIDVQGFTQTVRIAGNVLRETRAPLKRTGIRIGAHTAGITLAGNRVEGFAVSTEDLHGATPGPAAPGRDVS
jgi:hypothetical protein